MTAVIWTVIAALFQIVLLTLQQMAIKNAAITQAKSAKSQAIQDAVSSGDISKINAQIQGLRK